MASARKPDRSEGDTDAHRHPIDSSRIRQVDLMQMNLDAGEIVTLSMGGAESFEPLGA